ncbi:MAG TPA: Tom37 metaxin N-terminal-like domain-containing protein [Enhygromyxa sp.]|nr:Tom37 metaxin N-terminal-like domain-containing protein [Enhygromyxa sp.]
MSETIKVYGFAKLGELPDLSPFVSKLEGYLRLADVGYEKRPGDVRKAPRGKLPYIAHAGRKISDSQRIIEYLAEQGVCNLDDWLDDDQRAELFALRSMVETDLYFVLLHFRWQLDAGWAHYREAIATVLRGAGLPGFLLGPISRSIRKSTVAQMIGQGAGRRDTDENLAHAREMFRVLARFLERREGPWWFGDKPSSADAILHAFVAGTIVPKWGLPIEGLADPHPRLREWFEHVHAKVLAAG